MGVATLNIADPVRVDTTRLNQICDKMGLQNGEASICRAMEDVAALIQLALGAWQRSDLDALQPTAAQVAGVADRIGLTTLSQVATSVAELCVDHDDTALAATVARMVRLGERSLIAIWESQDVSV